MFDRVTALRDSAAVPFFCSECARLNPFEQDVSNVEIEEEIFKIQNEKKKIQKEILLSETKNGISSP